MLFWSFLVVWQITEARQCAVVATGLCEAGSGHCGKVGSGESDLSPARYWNNPEPSTTNWSTSLIGCLHWLAWQEGAPTPQSPWTDSTCGTQSGELGWRFFTIWDLNSELRMFLGWQVYSMNDTSSWVWQPALSLCLFAILPPNALLLQLPLPVSLTQRLFLVGAPALSISPLLLWQWELKEKEIPSVILTQICSPSILLFFFPYPLSIPTSGSHNYESLLLDHIISFTTNPFMLQHTWDVVIVLYVIYWIKCSWISVLEKFAKKLLVIW